MSAEKKLPEEAAKAELLKFVDAWFAKQAEYKANDPEAYIEGTKDDYVLWFWESGGEL